MQTQKNHCFNVKQSNKCLTLCLCCTIMIIVEIIIANMKRFWCFLFIIYWNS